MRSVREKENKNSSKDFGISGWNSIHGFACMEN